MEDQQENLVVTFATNMYEDVMKLFDNNKWKVRQSVVAYMNMIIGLVDYDFITELCLSATVRFWVEETH